MTACANCGHEILSKDDILIHKSGKYTPGDYPYSAVDCFCGCGNPSPSKGMKQDYHESIKHDGVVLEPIK